MTTAEIINNMKTHISNAYDSVESKGGKLESKNLFDKDDTNLIQGGYLGTNGLPNFSVSEDKTLILSIKPNTSYTISKISSSRFRIATFKTKPYTNMVPTNYLIKENDTYATITSGIDDNYLAVFYYSKNNDKSVSEEEIRNSIMINEGTEVLPYEPHNKPKNLQNLSSAIDSIDTSSNYLNFDLFNTSSNPNASSVFTKLKLNCSNRTLLKSACTAYINIEELEFTNTDNITSIETMCDGCSSLKKLVFGNADSLIMCSYMYNNASNLEEVYGFKNYGKGFTEQTAMYSKYNLSFSRSTKLTHDSMINIINNLYDLNLTYGVANGGTLYSQNLVLNSTNLAKLTDEEIAIATSKGWNVS